MNKQYRIIFRKAGDFMAFDTRELFARLLKCESGGEGIEGMRAVASVIINRSTVPYGEFARISNGGDVRAIITQPNQFTCLKTSVGVSTIRKMCIILCLKIYTTKLQIGHLQAIPTARSAILYSILILIPQPVQTIFLPISA